MTAGTITICVVDDDPYAREGLRDQLIAEPDLIVTGVFKTASEAIGAICADPPDMVLMDLHMQGMGGLAAIRELSRTGVPSRVLAVTSFDDEHTAADVLNNGGAGYVIKALGPRLPAYIRAAYQGGIVVPENVARTLGAALLSSRSRLDERERQVLDRIGTGLGDRAIADDLFVSRGTVRNIVATLKRKLNVASRAQLVVIAERYHAE